MSLSHGVMPLLYRTLNTTCPEAVPQAAMHQLRGYFYTNALRNLFLTQELLKLLNQFEAHRIPAIPFKGPVTAESVYGDLSLRQFCDLDILVRRQDVARAKELLLSQGYRPRFRLTPRQEAAHVQSQPHYSVERGDGRILLEIHWRISSSHFSSPLDFERLWERRQEISLDGKEVPTLCPEDLLLILCVHGTKHLWERFGWICDVAKLISAHKGMKWGRAMKEGGALGSERMLFLGLFLASDLLGAALPEEVLQTVRADRVVRSLAAHVREQLFRGGVAPIGVFERVLFHLKTKNRLSDRICYCLRFARHVMTPTVSEWQRLPLPDSLFPIYYLLRPMRLVAKRGLRLWKRLL